MFTEVTTEIKRATRTQVSRLEQQIAEMEKLTAEMKLSLNMVNEYGPCALRGVSERGIPEHMASVAAQMSKSSSALSMLADMTDAANAGTCEEAGA